MALFSDEIIKGRVFLERGTNRGKEEDRDGDRGRSRETEGDRVRPRGIEGASLGVNSVIPAILSSGVG